jgi:hypothetical protein
MQILKAVTMTMVTAITFLVIHAQPGQAGESWGGKFQWGNKNKNLRRPGVQKQQNYDRFDAVRRKKNQENPSKQRTLGLARALVEDGRRARGRERVSWWQAPWVLAGRRNTTNVMGCGH